MIVRIGLTTTRTHVSPDSMRLGAITVPFRIVLLILIILKNPLMVIVMWINVSHTGNNQILNLDYLHWKWLLCVIFILQHQANKTDTQLVDLQHDFRRNLTLKM